MAGAILAIGVLVFLAHFFTALFWRTRIPDVLLLMSLGLLLGPAFHLITPEDFGKVGSVMSTLALIVILFESGITIDPPVLARAVGPTVRLTFPTFLAAFTVAFLVSVYGLGFSHSFGWMSGAILGGVSVSVVIPLLKSMRIEQPLSTALVMEAAIGEVLSIVVLLSLVQGADSGNIAPAQIAGDILASMLMACLIGVLGGFAWLLVLERVRQFPNSAFTTLAFVFILYGIADELGYSGAITAFAFGATLTNHEYLPWRRLTFLGGKQPGTLEQGDISFFNEILFLLKTFFFVYMGASMSFRDVGYLGWALVFCAGLYATRLIIVRALIPGQGLAQDRVAASLLVPKGLVSAVLAGIPVERGLEGAEAIRDFAYMVILASVTVTAVMLALAHRKPVKNFYGLVFRTTPPAAVSQQQG